jgi:hypothetical protein
MTSFGKIILQTMRQLSKKDFDGALPYLLLTSKSESIVRDLLAFRLHEKFQGKNYVVAREWSRTDITVLAPVLRKETKQFEDPKAIIEIKMVAAPGKDNKNIHKHLTDLQFQLKERKKRKDRWTNTECFGLFVVRDFRETSPNSTSAFNGKFIKSKRESLSSNPNFHRSVEVLAKELKLSWAKPRTLKCGEDKWLQATVNLKWWLLSLR